MCDTLCVLPSWSQTKTTMLAKNSDREPNEPHIVRYYPAKDHAPNELLHCTYITIPEARHTHAVLLFKPDWIWGAEMGVNEHGVAIGNEAVFTKSRNPDKALTGMDLLRLGLERADTAKSALETIIEMLGEFGQGGNCGYTKDFRYDNSFLIADPASAYILETSGKNYAFKQVQDKDAISNRLFIRSDHSAVSGLTDDADFAGRFTEPVFSHFAKGNKRRALSLCAIENGPVNAAQLMRALRTHAPKFDGHEFSRGSVGSVCMHAGGIIGDHTTGSFVAVLRQHQPMTIWATGASTPCIAAFKPVFLSVTQPPVFDNDPQAHDYWLQREHIHRAILAGRLDAEAFRAKRDALEAAWLEEEACLFAQNQPGINELAAFASKASAQEQALIDEFSADNWRAMSGKSRFARYWRKQNKALK